jgi:hypothetical protein
LVVVSGDPDLSRGAHFEKIELVNTRDTSFEYRDDYNSEPNLKVVLVPSASRNLLWNV